MNELLGIGWYLWLFFRMWLISKVTLANTMFMVVMKKRYVLHYPFFLLSLAFFAACILNHPYQ
jgi:hypothetical protein